MSRGDSQTPAPGSAPRATARTMRAARGATGCRRVRRWSSNTPPLAWVGRMDD
jgi:hypothetical protein